MLPRLLLSCALATAVALAVSAGGDRAAPARAAGECPGQRIHRSSVYVDERRQARLEVYYDAATGKNCALMRHTGKAKGRKFYTAVYIYACVKGTKAGEVCRRDFSKKKRYGEEDGRFRLYAGPVYALARNRCIIASGVITDRQGMARGTNTGELVVGGQRARFCD